MTEQQWNEFFDKLEFVQLTGRWSLLPLHWLDDKYPESASELSRDLVEGLLELRDLDGQEERDRRVQAVCEVYREKLAAQRVILDARLTPPGSRVTLSHLDPKNPGRGDCLITVGSWDRVGYLLAELAHPGGEHRESVGESPLRVEPGELQFRHLLLFPDKGTPSPRAFRNLCEKTLRQARGLGARHIALTHLHLPQTGLADRFAAAEVVSAVRQMLRESPGVTVDILTFSHRNFADYLHWFESLKELSRASEGERERERVSTPSEGAAEPTSEMVDALRSFARRGSDLANEASASVTRWFSQSRAPEVAPPPDWSGFDYDQQKALNRLYLKKAEALEGERGGNDLTDLYLHLLARTVRLEQAEEEDESESELLLQEIERLTASLSETHPLWRYLKLLVWRISPSRRGELTHKLLRTAGEWEDLPLESFLSRFEEDRNRTGTNFGFPPVHPAGSRPELRG